MNSFLFLSLMIAALLGPFFALADDASKENPCTPVLIACEDAGYIYDKVAEPGQKIWADCADLILNKNLPEVQTNQRTLGIGLGSPPSSRYR